MQKTLMPDSRYFEDPRMSWLGLIGRVKPNISRTQSQADLAVIAAGIDQEQAGRVTIIKVANATLFAVPEERFFFLSAGGVLLVAVGLILLIACANIANLLLSRATVRRKEIAVKRALGASRWRLIRQLLAESLLLAILGGTLGSAIATWLSRPLLRLLLSHLPEGLPPLALDAGPDLHVLVYALGITLLTGIAFGLAPAIHATRADLSLAMKEEGAEAQSGSSRGGWLRNTLVGIQVAVCMALLLTAGLLLRGLTRAQTIDPGFSMKDIAVASFDLVGSAYSDGKAAGFQRQLAERVAAIPGIDRVAQAGVSPLSDNHVGSNFSVPGRNQDYDLEFTNVSPEYFSLLHIPLVRGRNFTVAETRAGSPVAILNETTARQLWPGEDPIGKHLREGSGGNDPGMEIVGIVKDVQLATLGETTTPFLFRPAGPKEQTRLLLMAHGTGDGILKNIKTAAQALDPDLAVNVTRLEDNMETWRSRSRIVSVLSAVLGGLALLLASLGVYGMVSYAASRRVREIGIRMALGADVRDIMWLIVRQGMRPVWIGAAVGVVCCAAISNLMSQLLYGVSPWDPVSFLVVPGLLVVVALAACWVPARRAAQADPVESLRCG
jgi:predicted permease